MKSNTTLTVRLPESLKEELRQIAFKEQISVSNYVLNVLQDSICQNVIQSDCNTLNEDSIITDYYINSNSLEIHYDDLYFVTIDWDLLEEEKNGLCWDYIVNDSSNLDIKIVGQNSLYFSEKICISINDIFDWVDYDLISLNDNEILD